MLSSQTLCCHYFWHIKCSLNNTQKKLPGTLRQQITNKKCDSPMASINSSFFSTLAVRLRAFFLADVPGVCEPLSECHAFKPLVFSYQLKIVDFLLDGMFPFLQFLEHNVWVVILCNVTTIRVLQVAGSKLSLGLLFPLSWCYNGCPVFSSCL